MKRWLSRLAVIVSLLGGLTLPAVNSFAQRASSPQDPQSITVYVTRTGAKYHRDGCRYLAQSKIPMSLKEAAKRFEPCKVCRPAILK
jgi:hypothetical protein